MSVWWVEAVIVPSGGGVLRSATAEHSPSLFSWLVGAMDRVNMPSPELNWRRFRECAARRAGERTEMPTTPEWLGGGAPVSVVRDADGARVTLAPEI